MNVDSSGEPLWRKSSYSSGAQTQCIEIATWRKSSYSSGAHSQCVEVAAWRKSTFSSGGESQCVEVASLGSVLVRDTTDRDSCTLSVSSEAWSTFTGSLR